MSITKKHYSFKKAYDSVSFGKIKMLRDDLQKALNVRSRTVWSKKYNDGIISPRIEIISSISEVFKKYGITNCWEIKDVKSKNYEE